MPKPTKKSSKPDAIGVEVVAQNRAASYNYHLLEKMEAGMALSGTEVKSLGVNLIDLSLMCGLASGGASHNYHI